MTLCNEPMKFSFSGNKPIVADFDGGEISSHGGDILLAQIDQLFRVSERIAACFVDKRDPLRTQHTIEEMVAQRIHQIAMGYPEADASDALRYDPVLRMAAGRLPESEGPLASQPTISRLENTADSKTCFGMAEALLDTFVLRYPAKEVEHLLLDIDSSEDKTHGQQEFTFFNKFYDNHCYLPLFVHVSVNGGEQQEPVAAVLRPCNKGNTYGVVGLMRQLIERFKSAYPGVKLHVRADSGFAFPELYELLEAEGVSYHIAFGKNSRLLKLVEPQMERLRQEFMQRLAPREKATIYHEVMYKAGPWNKERRVVAKLEILPDGKENPRFVIVSGPKAHPFAEYHFYCQRGDSENRIKELKLDLRSDLTSCHRFMANQFRLLLSLAACMLYRALRSKAADTELAKAQVGTLRDKLMRIGVRVVESVRRVRLYLPTSHPYQALFRQVATALSGGPEGHPETAFGAAAHAGP